MGSKSKVKKSPFESSTTGTQTSTPYAPIEPYLERALPSLEDAFGQSAFFAGSLLPEDSAETLEARRLAKGLGAEAATYMPGLRDLYAQQYGIATAAPGTSDIFRAETDVLANQARAMTERDKLIAQQQAMEAGQFGLGSTALGEMEALQGRQREELVQKQLAEALGREDIRRQTALGSLGDIRGDLFNLGQFQAGALEGIGADIEARNAARLAEEARIATGGAQEFQDRVARLIGIYGGLGSLGGTQTVDETTQGYNSQVVTKPSTLGQIAQIGAAGASAYAKSDIRLKTEIKRVGKLPNGIPVYRWEWTKEAKEIVDDQPAFGVLAQEVLEFMPDAVTLGTDGYYEVDYRKVLDA